MANVKVAINGFGRIGRLAFRQMFGAEGYEIVAINDLTKASMLAHLLKYDTAQGRYDGHTVEADDEANTITVDGKVLKIYAEKDAANCPWGELGVDVVLECTGFYCSKAIAEKKLRFFVIDGSGIANEMGLNGKHSSVMQAAFFYLNGDLLPYERALSVLKDTIRKKFLKKGDDIVQRNLLALDAAEKKLIEINYPEDWGTPQAVPQATPKALPKAIDGEAIKDGCPSALIDNKPTETERYFQEYISPILALQGDSLPVSAFSADGSVPLGTTRLEKHGVAQADRKSVV